MYSPVRTSAIKTQSLEYLSFRLLQYRIALKHHNAASMTLCPQSHQGVLSLSLAASRSIFLKCFFRKSWLNPSRYWFTIHSGVLLMRPHIAPWYLQ